MLSFRKLAPALAFAAAFTASPALADAIVFDGTDVGTNYTLNYDGNVSGSTVTGLTGTAVFTLTGISGNTYNFNYTVANTSTSPLTDSRISSFAFNVDPSITSASSTGAFSFSTLNSTYPNGVGTVDVCFKDAATGSCAGGGGGGLTMGQTGTGTFSLSFAQPVTSATLSDFFLRYQSISGAGFNGASGTGSGTVSSTSTSSGGTPVPEPGMLGLMAMTLMLGAAAHGRRRRQVLRAA